MADRWIVSSYPFVEQISKDIAESEAARLQGKYPKKKFKVYRIKTTLERSNAVEVIAALEKKVKELESLNGKRRKPSLD